MTRLARHKRYSFYTQAKGHDRGGRASATSFGEGGAYQSSYGQGCFGDFYPNSYGEIGTEYVAVPLQLKSQRTNLSKDVLVAFYDWLLSDSPWSEVYETLHGAEAVANNCVITNAGFSAGYHMSAMIAVRSTWENPEAIKLWHRLVTEEGYHPTLAYWVAPLVKWSVTVTGYMYTHWTVDHWPVYPTSFTADELRSFVRGKRRVSSEANYTTKLGKYTRPSLSFVARVGDSNEVRRLKRCLKDNAPVLYRDSWGTSYQGWAKDGIGDTLEDALKAAYQINRRGNKVRG